MMKPRKPLDLPMQMAKALIKDMRAFHAEPNAIKRDEIAQRQLDTLPKDPSGASRAKP
jgi:hypothetical protein